MSLTRKNRRELSKKRRGLACLSVAVLLVSAVAGQEATIRVAPAAREVVEGRLNKYGGDNAQRERTLMGLFQGAGCEGKNLSEQAINQWPLPNVICTLPGSSERTILVGAHYDHVGKGNGVVDNWSGASLLASLYQALKEDPRRHSYAFVGFADGELHLTGSRFYVQQMTEADKDRMDAMVDIDVLGLAPTEFWRSYADSRLVGKLTYLAGQLKLPISAVDLDELGSSDFLEFGALNIPSIMIHSLSQKTWDAHILRTRKDDISEIHMDDYYQSYRLVAAYLAFLDYSTFKRQPVERKSLRKSEGPK
ncbi:MAG: M28 family peptidase [Candidatus Acidiferrum sp.]